MIHIAVADLDAFADVDYVQVLEKNGAFGRGRLKRIVRAENPQVRRERMAASLLLVKMKERYNLKEPFLYNLSHSGRKVLCVVEDDKKGAEYLGCDIEKIGPVRKLVVKKAFTRDEQAWLLATSDQEKAFTRIWTLKESYIKAVRVGLRMPLKSVAFELTENGISLVDKTVRLNFKVSECEEKYCIAVCSDGKIENKIICNV